MSPSFLTRSSPCCWLHSLPTFFIACGLPNSERSSLPLLSVLPLLKGEHQEEGDWASEREDGIPEVWAPRGSFFGRRVLVLVLGCSEVFLCPTQISPSLTKSPTTGLGFRGTMRTRRERPFQYWSVFQQDLGPLRKSWIKRSTEREGFEPSTEVASCNSLAGSRFQPLSHLSSGSPRVPSARKLVRFQRGADVV